MRRHSRKRIVAALTIVAAVAVGAAIPTAASAKGKKSRTGDSAEQVEVRKGKGKGKGGETTTTTFAPPTDDVETTDASAVEDEPVTREPSFFSESMDSTLDTFNLLDIDTGPTTMADIVAQVGADDMWAAGYTGAGIDVAVIDTGVAPVADLSTTRVVVGPDLSFEGGVDAVAGLDTYGHGTHMAGIIAGRTPGADPLDPQPGDFVGVAPDAGIVSVKVADNTGAVDVSQVIAAIDWVVQHKQSNGLNIRVLNLSYNTSGEQSYIDDPLSKAVENAWDHGIVVVVSAGNEGLGSFGLANPATNPNVLAVSAAEWAWDFAWINPLWAPSGDGARNPDVLAPGVSIASLRVPGSRIDTEHPTGRIDGDDRLFLGSGTSQSAAVVSGAAALLLQQRPELSPDEVKNLLTATAADTYQFDIVKGNGVVDLATAMTSPSATTPQAWVPSTGLGFLEASRGADHVMIGGELLVGERTFTGAAWDPETWVEASESATAWSGATDLSGSTWSGSTWSGSTWSSSTWSGSIWS